MGLCASSLMNSEDREQAKIATFVRFAITADLAKLQEMLKRHKINPNAKDRFGMTAIHWASYVGALACLQELIKAGGSPQVADTNGRNALHHACRKDHDEVVRYLVTAAKMDVNARSENQDTPLHKAVRGKSVKVIETLLKLGADPNLRNEQERTPLEELEATMPTPTTESNGVVSARLSTQRETRSESRAGDNMFLDFIGLALQPIRRGSRSVERTEVKSYRSRSRRSIDDGSAHATARASIHEDSAQWASSPKSPKVADLYRSPPVSSRRKNLRYAGKRVIMAMRVRKSLPDVEKIQVIRLLLQKYTNRPAATGQTVPS